MTWNNWIRKNSELLPKNEIVLIFFENFANKANSTFLVLHGDEEMRVSDFDIKRAEKMIKMRREGMPIAYILQKKEFYGRDFLLGDPKTVLIPRPETETIIDLTKQLKPKPRKILDVGTGSGCIAITLGLEVPKAQIIGLDISKKALEIANKNKEKFGLDNVHFLRSDLMKNIEGNFDLIVANLPYVDKKWQWLDLKSLSFEPGLALYAEDAGLKLIYELFDQVKMRCKKIMLEADPCQHKAIKNHAKTLGFQHDLTDGYILQFSV